MTPRATVIPTLLAAIACGATGCGYQGPQSLPLPGAIGGSDTYQVTAIFADVTNLVPQETCRSNDTVIGSVESVTLDPNLKARVVCAVRNSVHLPGNAVGTLQETSLLGERYVAIGPPQGAAPTGTLRPGSVLPENAARVDPDTEQVLGALSGVLNGGNLGRIQDINRELNATLDGRSGNIRALLQQLTTLTGDLNRHRTDITTALDSLNHLSTTVAAQRDVLGSTLDTVPGGLQVLDRQRPKLTATLQQLDALSQVAVPLIAQSKDNTVADLQHLQPVLAELGKNGTEIASSLDLAVSFPFPDKAMSLIKGDYGGAFLSINVGADTVNELLRQSQVLPPGPAGPPLPGLPLPPLPGLPLPGVPLPGLPLPLPLGNPPGAPPSGSPGPGLGGLLPGGGP